MSAIPDARRYEKSSHEPIFTERQLWKMAEGTDHDDACRAITTLCVRMANGWNFGSPNPTGRLYAAMRGHVDPQMMNMIRHFLAAVDIDGQELLTLFINPMPEEPETPAAEPVVLASIEAETTIEAPSAEPVIAVEAKAPKKPSRKAVKAPAVVEAAPEKPAAKRKTKKVVDPDQGDAVIVAFAGAPVPAFLSPDVVH